MSLNQFPGHERFVALIDQAVANPCPESVTKALRKALCAMIEDREISLPDEVFSCCGEHYARRELYRSEKHDYAVIAMTWGPGQGTMIHDHAGLWCVEGVWRGALEITQYEPRERDGERVKFENCGTIVAGRGSAGSLIPPHEYHTIRNASDRDLAVSVHIYAKPMTCCSMFNPSDDGWFVRSERVLSLD